VVFVGRVHYALHLREQRTSVEARSGGSDQKIHEGLLVKKKGMAVTNGIPGKLRKWINPYSPGNGRKFPAHSYEISRKRSRSFLKKESRRTREKKKIPDDVLNYDVVTGKKKKKNEVAKHRGSTLSATLTLPAQSLGKKREEPPGFGCKGNDMGAGKPSQKQGKSL